MHQVLCIAVSARAGWRGCTWMTLVLAQQGPCKLMLTGHAGKSGILLAVMQAVQQRTCSSRTASTSEEVCAMEMM